MLSKTYRSLSTNFMLLNPKVNNVGDDYINILNDNTYNSVAMTGRP